MLLGPSDRCNRPAPRVHPRTDAACPVPGVGLLIFSLVVAEQSAKRHLRRRAGNQFTWLGRRNVRLFHRHFRLGFFPVFALAFRATFFAPFFLRAGAARFPRLAFFDFVFLRFLAMIILRYFNCNRCEPLGHSVRSRKPGAGRVRQAAREAGRRSPNRLIRLYARWGRSCQPRVV